MIKVRIGYPKFESIPRNKFMKRTWVLEYAFLCVSLQDFSDYSAFLTHKEAKYKIQDVRCVYFNWVYFSLWTPCTSVGMQPIWRTEQYIFFSKRIDLNSQRRKFILFCPPDWLHSHDVQGVYILLILWSLIYVTIIVCPYDNTLLGVPAAVFAFLGSCCLPNIARNYLISFI